MKVLCFGSLNIDYTYKVNHFVKKGETLSSDSLQVFSGGKGLNQSIALAKAGAEVYHAGAVGEDGRFLLEELEKAGVDVSCVTVRDDVRTGHAMIQNDPEGDEDHTESFSHEREDPGAAASSGGLFSAERD